MIVNLCIMPCGTHRVETYHSIILSYDEDDDDDDGGHLPVYIIASYSSLIHPNLYTCLSCILLPANNRNPSITLYAPRKLNYYHDDPVDLAADFQYFFKFTCLQMHRRSRTYGAYRVDGGNRVILQFFLTIDTAVAAACVQSDFLQKNGVDRGV